MLPAAGHSRREKKGEGGKKGELGEGSVDQLRSNSPFFQCSEEGGRGNHTGKKGRKVATLLLFLFLQEKGGEEGREITTKSPSPRLAVRPPPAG